MGAYDEAEARYLAWLRAARNPAGTRSWLAAELTDGALKAFAGGEKFFELGHFHCESRIMVSLLQRGMIKVNAAYTPLVYTRPVVTVEPAR